MNSVKVFFIGQILIPEYEHHSHPKRDLVVLLSIEIIDSAEIGFVNGCFHVIQSYKMFRDQAEWPQITRVALRLENPLEVIISSRTRLLQCYIWKRGIKESSMFKD